jgi:hypothetical protein
MPKRKSLRFFKLLAPPTLCALFACAVPLHAQTRRARNTTTQATRTTTQATPAPTTAMTQATPQAAAPASSPNPVPAQSPSVPEEDADLVIIANVQAKELRFETVPNPNVEFPGQPQRATEWSAERTNLPRPVQPGVTYRDIGIRLKIVSRFADIDRIVAEALGETPPTDDTPQPSAAPPNANDAAQANNTAQANDTVEMSDAAQANDARRATRKVEPARVEVSLSDSEPQPSHAATVATSASGARVATTRTTTTRAATKRGARASRRLR